MCRVALDGKEGDIPLETRARIVHLMTICTPPPPFKCCVEMQLQGVIGSLDDPFVQPGGQFLTNEELLRKRCAEGLQVVNFTPPSSKQLWDKNNYPETEEIRAIALAAFGISDAASMRAV